MPELRKDPVVGRWVIVATERNNKPLESSLSSEPTLDPVKDPFLEGHEQYTPPEIFAFRASHSAPNGPGWNVRVVPNKFPVLRIEDDLTKEAEGIFDKMGGVGAHEIIIETPRHDQALEDQSIDGIARVLEAYKIRILDLMRDSRFRYIMIFKNVGLQAGATMGHPHSQLIALPITPIQIKEKLAGAKEYFEFKDRNIFEDILKQELKEKQRLVYENASFVAYCPYAARFPFEICIMPRKQSPDYHSIEGQDLMLLADILKNILRKLNKALNKPQYNLILNTAPIRYARKGFWGTIEYDFRWHIEIVPRLTYIAGFEVGTGFYINPTRPEDAAAYLNNLKLE
ncbi:MAG: DUF4921 family protein [Verrucomicrobiota bacterium]|nr:DUF4921 family protein [Verrucomicrobiota bacterium]